MLVVVCWVALVLITRLGGLVRAALCGRPELWRWKCHLCSLLHLGDLFQPVCLEDLECGGPDRGAVMYTSRHEPPRLCLPGSRGAPPH